MRKYTLKVDDAILFFLENYHQIDVSNAMSFFDGLAKQCKELKPNITNNSRRTTARIGGKKNWNRTDNVKGRSYDCDDRQQKYYVIRGFYPETNIPFKMVAVLNGEGDRAQRSSSNLAPNEILHIKITLGVKEHFTLFNNEQIDLYNEGVVESIITEQEVQDECKIDYKKRKFKCMKPKGMDLMRSEVDKERIRAKARERYHNAKKSRIESDDNSDK